MKYLIKIYIIYMASILGLNCHVPHGEHSRNKFQFQSWRAAVLNKFDDLILNNREVVEKGLTNFEIVRKEIEYVNQPTFNEILDSSLQQNKLKHWDKMYVIYHYFEGEVNFSLSTFIFYQHSKSWGITYNHSLIRYRKISLINHKEIDKIQSLTYGGGNALIIISKFDRNYQNLFNNILVGVSNEDEVPQIMKIYDKSNFD